MIGMIRRKIVPFGMSRDLAVQRIRRLVEAGKYGREPHFKEQMAHRGILMRDVCRVLTAGHMRKDPKLDDYGDWRCVLSKRLGGDRIRVVVALTGDSFVTLVTTY